MIDDLLSNFDKPLEKRNLKMEIFIKFQTFHYTKYKAIAVQVYQDETH
jgi:hypothetical protein